MLSLLLRKSSALLSLLILFCALNAGTGSAQVPVVKSVLFYSPSCGHCHYVITEILPPLVEQYGDQLLILGVNTSEPGGQALYQAAIEHFRIPPDRRGVPTLILGDTVLVGSQEIPDQFPALIAGHLAAGGIGWPDIPGLAEAMAPAEPPADTADEPMSEPVPEQAADDSMSEPASEQAAPPTAASVAANQPRSGGAIAPAGDLTAQTAMAPTDIMGRLQRDPAGNTLAILVLVAMVTAVGYVAMRSVPAMRTPAAAIHFGHQMGGWRVWSVAILCLVGLGVSLYMAYVETTQTAAVCGPIGDCNTVQQSPYATLFGLIPIGVLGILGYIAMLAAWAGTRWGRGRLRSLSESALLGMALVGTLFSIYLTFLEPFVIGATCAWCLSSAVIMTLILLLVASSMPIRIGPARQAARRWG